MDSQPNPEGAHVRQGVLLRVHIAATDLVAALADAQRLAEFVAGYVRPLKCDVERYWKIPEHFVVTLDLEASDRITDFHRLVAALATSWVTAGGVDDDLGAVWDHRMSEGFVLPSARWAHLNSFSHVPAASMDG